MCHLSGSFPHFWQVSLAEDYAIFWCKNCGGFGVGRKFATEPHTWETPRLGRPSVGGFLNSQKSSDDTKPSTQE